MNYFHDRCSLVLPPSVQRLSRNWISTRLSQRPSQRHRFSPTSRNSGRHLCSPWRSWERTVFPSSSILCMSHSCSLCVSFLLSSRRHQSSSSSHVSVPLSLHSSSDPRSAHRAMAKAADQVYTAILRDGHQRSVVDLMQTRDELYESVLFFFTPFLAFFHFFFFLFLFSCRDAGCWITTSTRRSWTISSHAGRSRNKKSQAIGDSGMSAGLLRFCLIRADGSERLFPDKILI